MAPERTRRPFGHVLGLAALIAGAGACIPDVVPDQFSLPNCDRVEATCGPSSDESCCAGGKVTGGDFLRDNKTSYPAHVSSFVLDRFEVTVGRFRQFVAGYPANRPAKDAGKHPKIPGSGWQTAWDKRLPTDQADLRSDLGCNQTFATWTDTPGANENLPINCVSWYVAFAFRAWDGGRLPTDAEWNYAAEGGDGMRPYPWGDPSPQTVDVLFNCQSSLGMCIRPVGAASPASDGFYGQADLAGSMAEWLLDFRNVYKTPCTDCASLLDGGNGRQTRGGDFVHDSAQFATDFSIGGVPETPMDMIGIRCARDL
jgi:formylglycine-generating enzyme required for sulfatase activity